MGGSMERCHGELLWDIQGDGVNGDTGHNVRSEACAQVGFRIYEFNIDRVAHGDSIGSTRYFLARLLVVEEGRFVRVEANGSPVIDVLGKDSRPKALILNEISFNNRKGALVEILQANLFRSPLTRCLILVEINLTIKPNR